MAYDCTTQGLWQVKNPCSNSRSTLVLFFLSSYIVPLTQCGLHSAADLLALEAADKEAFERRGVEWRGGQSQAETCPQRLL